MCRSRRVFYLVQLSLEDLVLSLSPMSLLREGVMGKDGDAHQSPDTLTRVTIAFRSIIMPLLPCYQLLLTGVMIGI